MCMHRYVYVVCFHLFFSGYHRVAVCNYDQTIDTIVTQSMVFIYQHDIPNIYIMTKPLTPLLPSRWYLYINMIYQIFIF